MLELIFPIFKTEAVVDYLSVYDGNSTSSTLIGKYSGKFGGPYLYINSSSNNLYLTFSSNNETQDFGFRGRYRGELLSKRHNADNGQRA